MSVLYSYFKIVAKQTDMTIREVEIWLRKRRKQSATPTMKKFTECRYDLIRINIYSNYYTPGIYADGYIVFAFPFVRSYVRSLVRFFVRNSGTFVEFMSKFWLKFL